MADDRYEVFEVRYGTIATRTRRENLMGLDPHESAPMPLDFFVWVIRAPSPRAQSTACRATIPWC